MENKKLGFSTRAIHAGQNQIQQQVLLLLPFTSPQLLFNPRLENTKAMNTVVLPTPLVKLTRIVWPVLNQENLGLDWLLDVPQAPQLCIF